MEPTNLHDAVPAPPTRTVEILVVVADGDYQWKQYFAAQTAVFGMDAVQLRTMYFNLVILQAQKEERYRAMLTASWAMLESDWEG
jgi:hypothetical protein